MNRGMLAGAAPFYASTPRSVAAADVITVTGQFDHTGRVAVKFRCVTAVGGFVPGDVVDIDAFNDGSGGIGIVRNNGRVRVVIGSSGVASIDPAGGGATTLSSANFEAWVEVYP